MIHPFPTRPEGGEPERNAHLLRVLLIEDDEDDFVWVRALLSELPGSTYELEWVKTYEAALEAIQRGHHDVCLLDYHLGDRNGLEFLREVKRNGLETPVIFLTGQGDYKVDLEAMRIGASDYLVKSQINPPLLERSIRYAIERKRAESALRESQRQLKQFSYQLLTIQEEERKRIAGELHDSIGPSLSAIKFTLENTIEEIEKGIVKPESIQNLIFLTQHTIEESGRIVSALRPPILDDLGIVLTIHWFCKDFQNTYSNIQIDEEVTLKEREIPESLKMTVFRVIQEAFHNIAKYSQAKKAHLSFVKKDKTIELVIRDDGIGFNLKEIAYGKGKAKGMGLTNMRERTEISGGSFHVESTLGKGTTVRASWPCD